MLSPKRRALGIRSMDLFPRLHPCERIASSPIKIDNSLYKSRVIYTITLDSFHTNMNNFELVFLVTQNRATSDNVTYLPIEALYSLEVILA
jgi:hypothetical protein